MNRKVGTTVVIGIVLVILVAVVLIISQTGRNEKRSAEKIFPPLPDGLLYNMSAELGEHLNMEIPELKVSKVKIGAKTNKITGWVKMTVEIYRINEGIEVPLTFIGSKEMPNAQEAFRDLKRKTMEHLKSNSFP